MPHEFDAETIAGVSGYMNDETMRGNLTEIVKWSMKDDSILDATLTHFDGDGFDATVTRESGTETVRVPWLRDVQHRSEVREQIMALFERAVFGFGAPQ